MHGQLGIHSEIAVDATYAYSFYAGLYRYPLSGPQMATILSSESPYDSAQNQIVTSGGRVYWATGELRSVDADGSDEKVLLPGAQVTRIDQSADALYFVVYSNGPTLGAGMYRLAK